jgi:hypothetical protein
VFADGVSRYLRQHGAEIEFRVQPVELGGTDERVYGSGSLAAAVGSDEEEDDTTAMWS